ncbi:Na+/H+ antiporter subunit A [Paenibacillus sabuli]|nr:Na+/H+ antiporter subunit A [Paenibacillus sabuli]
MLLHAAVLLPLLFTIFVPLLYKAFPKLHTGWAVLAVPVVLFVFFVMQIPGQMNGGSAQSAAIPWIPALDISFALVLDGLSLLFALLITGIGALVVLYSISYLSRDKEAIHRFYVYLLLFMGAMLGVVLSDNLIVLYGFWELTSLSSFLLIAFWYKRDRSRYGALKSMLITVAGGFAMLGGFVLLYVMGGTFSIRELVAGLDGFSGDALFVPAMLLVLLGAFTKSAQFPFHIWLPDAMEAPTPVSAYLHSATMVKAGLYLVARMSPVFAGEAVWFWLVSGVGLATLLWGSYCAVRQTDLKAVLAYSTISQLGLIMSLLGIGSAAAHQGMAEDAVAAYAGAIAAALFHLFNHATFKGTLFMVVGIVDHETGTRDLRRLGGLMALMPVTFALALVASFSMAGIPPFNGFLSKEMFFTGALKAAELSLFGVPGWSALFPIIAWAASVFTFIYCMIVVFKTFAGRFKAEALDHKPHEAPLLMLVPPAVLASLVIVVGLFPGLVAGSLIEPALAAVLPAQADAYHVKITMWHGWTTELFMTIGVVAVGIALFLTLRYWQGIYALLPGRLTFNRVYDGLLRVLDRGSLFLTGRYMTGSLRHYLIYIFAFMIGLLGWMMLRLDVLGGGSPVYAELSFYEVVLVAVIVLAALAVPLAASRLTAILLTGAVGYIVSLLFVVLRAPDLALTQLIVETVSVTLFLLCFYHLPKLRKEMAPLPFKLGNALISVGVGLVVTTIALVVSGARKFDSISDFFIAQSYELAGGRNMVNVILVDFRGFDTLLEIMVLGIASLGIYALIKLRLADGEGGERLENK